MKCKDRYVKLAKFGQILLTKKSIPDGLPHISEYAKEVLDAQRCSIFIYDSKKEELWTTLADGVEKITLPSNKGLVGQTLKEKKPFIENAPYSSQYFLPEVDTQTGFTTQNIITAPIFDSSQEVIGVLELLNKDGDFNKEDAKFMTFFAHYISGFLELINVYIKEGKCN
jgi:signal transduction protein with GAF and PtsI domain